MAKASYREERLYPSLHWLKSLAGCRLVLTSALMAALVSGCAHQPELTPQVATSVAANQALIFPPIGGPGILGIVETTHSNAVTQEISLATEARTPGQNKITVTLFQGKGGDGSDAGLVDVPFTQVNLTQEALAAWPNSGMAVSPYYVQNAYGPFGYAVGRPSTGDTCLYAWQRIEPALKPSGAIARGAVVVRLQLCDSRRSEESLLGVMYQLRLNTPVYEPSRASPQIGRIAVTIKPEGAAGFIPVVKPVVRPAPSRPRQPAAPAVVPAATIPAGAPIVPLPGGATSSSSPIVPPPTAASTSVIVPPPPTGSGP
ncbi:MAG: hypothetical protein JWP26_2660 [Devosia sp.]|nr:hypothetical protein [Devosia sp.]